MLVFSRSIIYYSKIPGHYQSPPAVLETKTRAKIVVFQQDSSQIRT